MGIPNSESFILQCEIEVSSICAPELFLPLMIEPTTQTCGACTLLKTSSGSAALCGCEEQYRLTLEVRRDTDLHVFRTMFAQNNQRSNSHFFKVATAHTDWLHAHRHTEYQGSAKRTRLTQLSISSFETDFAHEYRFAESPRSAKRTRPKQLSVWENDCSFNSNYRISQQQQQAGGHAHLLQGPAGSAHASKSESMQTASGRVLGSAHSSQGVVQCGNGDVIGRTRMTDRDVEAANAHEVLDGHLGFSEAEAAHGRVDIDSHNSYSVIQAPRESFMGNAMLLSHCDAHAAHGRILRNLNHSDISSAHGRIICDASFTPANETDHTDNCVSLRAACCSDAQAMVGKDVCSPYRSTVPEIFDEKLSVRAQSLQ